MLSWREEGERRSAYGVVKDDNSYLCPQVLPQKLPDSRIGLIGDSFSQVLKFMVPLHKLKAVPIEAQV